MKNKTKIIIGLLVVFIITVCIFTFYKNENKPLINNSQNIPQETIKGTYIGTLAKDVYTLTILSQQGETFTGTLDIKNFEKDSSTGTLVGTYKNGILLADYTFQSEGTESVGWVVFKKVTDGFIRGFGNVDPETKSQSINLEQITFDNSVVYKLSKNQNYETSSNISNNQKTLTGIANPASVNCSKVGGNLKIEKDGNGNEYGLCYFEDNRACEEWALVRGNCPIGGIKTTGYDTIDQKYCAWLGGQTSAVDNSICTFKNGSTCSTIDLYKGKCSHK